MKLRGGRPYYGHVLGVLLLETRFPRVPGDVGNAESYPFPVLFKVVRGATIKRVVKEADRSLLEPFLEAALEIEPYVKAITTSCGFLVLFQDELASRLRVPVFTSSLLMVPLVQRLVGGKVGIVTADSSSLTERHLEAAGIAGGVYIKGLENKPEFSRAILGNSEDMDVGRVEEEVVKASKELVEQHPDVKALVFECHNLSPFSKSVQRETGLPVFDFISFAKFVYSAVVKQSWSWER